MSDSFTFSVNSNDPNNLEWRDQQFEEFKASIDSDWTTQTYLLHTEDKREYAICLASIGIQQLNEVIFYFHKESPAIEQVKSILLDQKNDIPRFSFYFSNNDSHYELQWDDAQFNSFINQVEKGKKVVEKVEEKWTSFTYCLSSADNKCYVIRLGSSHTNEPRQRFIYFQPNQLAKSQVENMLTNEKVRYEDALIEQKLQQLSLNRQKSIEAYKQLKNSDNYFKIYEIKEIWSHVTAKNSLIILDLDFTLAYDESEHGIPKASIIEKDLNDQLSAAKQQYPGLTFIMITNTGERHLFTKLEQIDLTTKLFDELLAQTDESDKSLRLETYLANSSKSFNQIIIVDDSMDALQQVERVAQEHQIECTKLHFFGAMMSRLRKQAKMSYEHLTADSDEQLDRFLNENPEYNEIYEDTLDLEPDIPLKVTN